MKLQILISQYKENEDVIHYLLDSISLQQGVNLKEDLEVIIVNDGSDVILLDYFINKYEYKIKYILKEHSGVSATRNRCLQESSSDYVMFCDADDMFVNSMGLHLIMKSIENGGFDILVSEILCENRIEDSSTRYSTVKRDSEFVHGKVFRRKYLTDNNIHWYDPLTFSGDTYFLQLAMRLTNNILYCNIPFYMWKWNNDSICRREKNHFVKAYGMKLKGDDAIIREFQKRNRMLDAEFEILKSIYDSYCMMNKKEWLEEDTRNIEKQFHDFYMKYKHTYLFISHEKKKEMLDAVMKCHNMSTSDFDKSFNEWIFEKEAMTYA